MIEERRLNPFTERLSRFMVVVAALGAFLVLFDPKLTVSWISIGGEGFSADLKGAVISAILIGGWTAVKEYWLGSSIGNVKSSESVQRIAEAAPASSAAIAAASTAAVAAATGATPPPVIPLTGTVTPAPMNPDTGVTPAAEVVQPPKGQTL